MKVGDKVRVIAGEVGLINREGKIETVDVSLSSLNIAVRMEDTRRVIWFSKRELEVILEGEARVKEETSQTLKALLEVSMILDRLTLKERQRLVRMLKEYTE